MTASRTSILESDARDETIARELSQMARLAEDLQEYLRKHPSEMRSDWYIRINREGYRAVSLNDETPLKGFAKHGAKNIETVMHHFRNSKDGLPEKPSKEKSVPERRVQCWLIKQALTNKEKKMLDLKSASRLDNGVYKELLFTLDEVSIGGRNHQQPAIRCDILAVGVDRGGNASPVLIELKSDHNLTRLREQLKLFCREIVKYRREFEKLLKACSGRKVTIPQKPEQVKKMIIWNKRGRLKSHTINTLKKDRIDLVEYKANVKFYLAFIQGKEISR